MYEYIVEALKSDGYSSHLESAILATGQGIQSYFLRSRKLDFDDAHYNYAIDMNNSNLEENQFTVKVTSGKKLVDTLEYSFSGPSKLSFWIVGCLVNGKEPQDGSSEILYEQARNLFSPTPSPAILPNEEVIIHLKYEPVDWYVLHEIAIDFGS